MQYARYLTLLFSLLDTRYYILDTMLNTIYSYYILFIGSDAAGTHANADVISLADDTIYSILYTFS